MTATKLPAGWIKRTTNGRIEYVREADGARVYQRSRPAWGPALWCAHPRAWPHGDLVDTTRAGAIDFIERHYPVAGMFTGLISA
ncbi:MAG: hypothetical protein ACK5VI_01780 [Opitutia bacterium]